MRKLETNQYDAVALGLGALGWAVSDQGRADRLLALTGLTAGDLRARATDRTMLAAVLGFLEAHEPDLIGCAEALGVPPIALAQAREELER